MTLEIPAADRALLKRWLITNEEPLDTLLAALAKATPTLQRSALAKSVAETAGMELSKVDDALRVLIRLCRSVAEREEANPTIRALFATIMENTINDAEKFQTFENNLKRVSSLKSVVVTGKALAIMMSNANSFCNARTFSEIRPIFSDETMKTEAVVVVHQLRILYHSGPDHALNEIFVALDTTDLTRLQTLIERTIKKDAEITNLVSDGIAVLKG